MDKNNSSKKNNYNENNIKKYFNKEKNLIDKNLLIENLKILGNIYFIEYEYYHNNILNKSIDNKLYNNKLIEILYNYEKYKKRSKLLIEKYKLFELGNFIEEKNKEETLMHYRSIVERNTTILDFMNGKKD